MPVYEYICRSCGEEFDQLVFSNESVPCPACGSSDIQKKVSRVGSLQGACGSVGTGFT